MMTVVQIAANAQHLMILHAPPADHPNTISPIVLEDFAWILARPKNTLPLAPIAWIAMILA